jgi:hypothetical protein
LTNETRSEGSSGNSATRDSADVSLEARDERSSATDDSRASDLSSALMANFSDSDADTKAKEKSKDKTEPETTAGQVTVKQGDTVWGSLRTAGYSDQEIVQQGLVDKVAQASGLQNADQIRPGDVLNLPTREGGQVSGDDRQVSEQDINSDEKLKAAAEVAAAEAGLPADAVPGTGSTAQSELVPGSNDMRQGTLTLRDPNTGEVLGTYEFNNGGFGKGSIPDGTYEVSGGYTRNDKSGMISDGVGYSFVLTQEGMAPGTADDPRYNEDRSLLRIHPDGNNAGTEGCIGILGDAETQREFYENAQRLAELGGGSFTLEFG